MNTSRPVNLEISIIYLLLTFGNFANCDIRDLQHKLQTYCKSCSIIASKWVFPRKMRVKKPVIDYAFYAFLAHLLFVLTSRVHNSATFRPAS